MNSLLIPSCAISRLAPISKLISRSASVSLWKTLPFRSSKPVAKFCTQAAPDVRRLAETARITLTEKEVEEVGPKIQQVLDWFGQLQAVDLDSVAPAIRAGLQLSNVFHIAVDLKKLVDHNHTADTEGDNLRDDVPEIFENREAIIAAIPSYEAPYIKVPKVLNKE